MAWNQPPFHAGGRTGDHLVDVINITPQFHPASALDYEE
jgi:hypothetical protein